MAMDHIAGRCTRRMVKLPISFRSMLENSTRRNTCCVIQYSQLVHSRRSSTSASSGVKKESPSQLLSSMRRRIGACVMFGLEPRQSQEAAAICQILSSHWRELSVGREGFLSGPGRRGLWRRKVDWGEMDCMGHVNNVIYNRWTEAARVNWALNFASIIDPANAEGWRGLVGPRGIGLILKFIKTEFKFPMIFPDRVTVLHKLSAPPNAESDSFGLEVVLLSEKHQRIAARCTEENVIYDYVKGKRTAMPGFMVEAFGKLFEEQEAAKKQWSQLADDVERRLRALEVGSWDRKDAVEKTGM